MPPRKYGTTRRRLDRLEDVSRGEIVRWNLGIPLLRGKLQPVEGLETAHNLHVWDSWGALFKAYRVVRGEYLAWYQDRIGEKVPGIERLYAAHVAGGDAGAEDEAALINEESKQQDPRRAWKKGVLK